MSPNGMRRLLTFSPADETLETPPAGRRRKSHYARRNRNHEALWYQVYLSACLPYRGRPKHINYCFIEPLKARPRQNLAASKMGTTGMQGA